MTLKATLEQLRRHNRELLLRAVYGGMADNRAALAQLSGLTKPTVSSLVSELLEEGLLSERGHGPSTDSGGKRPRLLRFERDARQVIGVAVETGRALAVLSDLAGHITARHSVELPTENLVAARAPERPALRSAVRDAVLDAVDGLRAQLDAPLLCVGVGVPARLADGHPEDANPALDDWKAELHERFGVPAHLANTAELCALGQLAFGTVDAALGSEGTPGTSVTLMIDEGVEVGVALDHGALHYGTDIGGLRVGASLATTGGMAYGAPDAAANGSADRADGDSTADATLAGTVRWERTRERLRALGVSAADGASGNGFDYLHLQAAARHGDGGAETALAELAAALAPVIAWVTALLRPDQVTIAGPIVDLGASFLDRLQRDVAALSPSAPRYQPRLGWAYAADLGSIGAVALALQAELGLL